VRLPQGNLFDIGGGERQRKGGEKLKRVLPSTLLFKKRAGGSQRDSNVLLGELHLHVDSDRGETEHHKGGAIRVTGKIELELNSHAPN